MVVLVVEDSSTMRQLICYALKRIAGIVLVEATDGSDALIKLGEIKPDVILTDLNMPVMDGFTLIDEIRKRPDLKDTPIIVLTTEGALPDQARANSLAVSAYVTKPIRQDRMVDAVLKAAGRVNDGA
jgi:two-component system chemotaxis response regulator CheY